MNKNQFNDWLNKGLKAAEFSHLTPADADKLMEVSSRANGDMGSAVARSVALYLQRGENELAARVYRIDHDKVRQYPELHAYMNSMFKVEWE